MVSDTFPTDRNPKAPAPPPRRYADGSFETGRTRIRNGWFGAVAEELIEHADGSRTWRRIPFPKDVDDFKRRT
jgi:hypothetical protein